MDRRTLFKMGLAALGAAVVPSNALQVRGEEFPDKDLGEQEFFYATNTQPEPLDGLIGLDVARHSYGWEGQSW